jgi:H+/gluconate symporter-like permease
MGVFGVILAVIVLIAMAMRGVNIILASLVAALVAAVFNQMPLASAVMEAYAGSTFGFAQKFFLLFLTGAVFGQVMGESKAANSLAYALSHWLGPERTLWIAMLVCALLTYGGVNVFVVIFTVYPLGLGLMQRSNTPKRLFIAATALGAGTFTMTALPGTPSLHNVIMAQAMGTPLTAAPWTGIAASILMIGFGMAYLEWEKKRAQARGESFVPAPTDVLPDKEPDPRQMPHWLPASLPLLTVLLIIVLPLVFRIILPPEPNGAGAYNLTVNYAASQPLLWPAIALTIGTLFALILFFRHLIRPIKVLGRGAENSILPLINTSVVIGFGGVITATPIFERFAEFMLHSDLPPLVSALVAVNIISGIVGSSSGGLGIFAASLGEHYLQAGADPALLHRLVAIGAGGLDSLPHCGAVITMLTIMGMTHKQCYKDVAVVTIVVPLAALAIVTTAVLITGAG